MVSRRAHTIIEVLAAYALFTGLLVAAMPNPRAELDDLRASFEREVARGILEGELAVAEWLHTKGATPPSGPLDPASWPSAPQLAELSLRLEVAPEAGGQRLVAHAAWVSASDGTPRELALDGWLRDRGGR